MNTKTQQFKSGDKITLAISFEAEVITDLNEVSYDDLTNLVLKDDAYGLKSIIVGIVSDQTEEDHDTEIRLFSTTVEIERG